MNDYGTTQEFNLFDDKNHEANESMVIYHLYINFKYSLIILLE
jgi:hypothetical protein